MTAEEAILRLLARRSPGATICPSEAARLIGPEDWQARMPEAHAAARALAAAGRVELLQAGKAVRAPRGAYRIGRRPGPD